MSPEARARFAARVLGITFFAAGLVAALAPLALLPVAALGLGLSALAVVADISGTELLEHAPVRLLVIFCAFAAASLFWTTAPAEAGVKLAHFVILFVPAVILAVAMPRILAARHAEGSPTTPLAWGAALGLVLLLIEIALGWPATRLVNGMEPGALIDMNAVNRNLAALTMFCWPAAAALALTGSTAARPAGLVLLCAVGIAAWHGQSLAAEVAFAAAAVTALCARFLPALVRYLVPFAIILAFMAPVPVALGLHLAGVEKLSWLPGSARHRVEIWREAAERATEAPFAGWGLEASRRLPPPRVRSRFMPADEPTFYLHPHSGFLQVRLELGIAGSLILLAFVLSLVQPLMLAPGRPPAYASAALAAALVIAGVAFGIWQGWWMATLTLTLVALLGQAVPANTSQKDARR